MGSENFVTYEGFYVQSMKDLKKNLREQINENTLLISLGRKGVKIFEFLFSSNDKDGEAKIPDVVSEHALPFISMRDEGKDVDYQMLDDALYFGSSAKGVAEEIYALENIYKIHGRNGRKINFYSAIETDELRPHFDQYIGTVHAKSTKDNGIGAGYSHFFAKRFAEDIRRLEDTFEVEYPIVTFKLDRCIGLNEWKEVFERVFHDIGKVYVVEHEENYSINILFDKTNGCSFRKLRIFPSNCSQQIRSNRVKVVCMAPHPVWNEDYLLERIFDSAHEEYRDLWLDIYDKCNIKQSKINPDNILDYLTVAKRRCNKSLVIMLNYLLSYSAFIEQKDRLNEVFSEAGLNAKFQGVDENKDLYFLLGNKDLCQKVAGRLDDFYRNGTLCGDVYTSKDIRFDYTIFENSENVDKTTSTLIHIQNKSMVEKSRNVEEALGALFFNQDSFYEKQLLEMNPITQDFSRLRMGYTFDALFQIIGHFIDLGILEKEDGEDIFLTIHRWVDQRIGEGSIVPQYILDEKSKHWVRVFRHGENEDTLLSHLARYALMVFREWNKIIPFGRIEKNKFQELLATLYKECIKNLKGNEIVESKNITFTLDKDDCFAFVNNHYHNSNPRNVLQYLIDMCIFTEEEERISIHRRTNFIMPPAITTLEWKDEEAIKGIVLKNAEELKAKYLS